MAGSILVAPHTIYTKVKGNRGVRVYNSVTSNQKKRFYLKTLKKTRKLHPGLTEAELNRIIIRGFAEEFCSGKTLASRKEMKEYVLKKIKSLNKDKA